jgi:tartrate-resistant acid phosphatase type 5
VNIGQYYSNYIGNYVGSYGPGSVPNRFFPALGNHDIIDGGGLGAYLAYFTLPDSGVLDTSTSGNERYYDFVCGPIHFFAIDSDASEVDGRDSTSTQAQWLKAQLAASTSPWQVVYYHHPAYSSAYHGSELVMQWPFEDWGVDVTFAGHDHVYERLLVDQNGDGETIPYFVTGAGGQILYAFGTPLAESVVRYSSDYGAMIVEATDEYMNFKFYSINTSHGAAGLIDDYTIRHEYTGDETTWGTVKALYR